MSNQPHYFIECLVKRNRTKHIVSCNPKAFHIYVPSPQFEQFARYWRMGPFVTTTEKPNCCCRYFRNANRTGGMGRLNLSQLQQCCTAPYLKAFWFCLCGRQTEMALMILILGRSSCVAALKSVEQGPAGWKHSNSLIV